MLIIKRKEKKYRTRNLHIENINYCKNFCKEKNIDYRVEYVENYTWIEQIKL